MDKRTTGIVAYITWIGLVIALCAGADKRSMLSGRRP